MSVAASILTQVEAYWTGEDLTGADLLGLAPPVTFVGGVTLLTPGHLGARAWHFAAAAQQAAFLPDLDYGWVRPGEGFTVAAWVKFDSLTDTSCIVKRGSAVSEYQFYAYPGGASLAVWDSGGGLHSADATVTLGTGWHHLCGVYDRAHVLIYVDGVLAGSVAFTGDVRRSRSNLQIGRILDGSGNPLQWLDGAIADLGLWSRALTQAEITALQADRPWPPGRVPVPLATATDTLLLASTAPGEGKIWQEWRSGPGRERMRRTAVENTTDTLTALFRQVSRDDGQTWTAPVPDFPFLAEYPGGEMRETFSVAFVYDPASGLCLRVRVRAFTHGGQQVFHCDLIGSPDNGETWPDELSWPLDYEAGGTFNPNAFQTDALWRDHNQGLPGVNFWPAAGGGFLFGLGNTRDPATGAYFGSVFGDSSLGAVLLTIRWTGATYQVTPSNPVSFPSNTATYGASEPGVFRDGAKVGGAWRTDNTQGGGPATHFHTYSTDGGATLGAPQVQTYDTGAGILAPSASPWFVPVGGRIYFLWNENPLAGGSDPRNPLAAARLDTTLTPPKPQRATTTPVRRLREQIEAPNTEITNLAILAGLDGRTVEVRYTAYKQNGDSDLAGDARLLRLVFAPVPSGLSVDAAADYVEIELDGLFWNRVRGVFEAKDASRPADYAVGVMGGVGQVPVIGAGAFTLHPKTIRAGFLSPSAADTALAPTTLSVTAPDAPKLSAGAAAGPALSVAVE